MMKIENARWTVFNSTYAVTFTDGISIILDEKMRCCNMISTGLDSYFIIKGKWPGGKNLEKRVSLAGTWIEKNKNRYKKKS